MMKKGIERVSSDIGLIFISYNFRRLINILGIQAGKALYGLIFNMMQLIMPLLGQPDSI